MSAKPGLTLIEIVLGLGLMALLFSFSMIPALYAYRQVTLSDERNDLELLGMAIQDTSVRAFVPLSLRFEAQGSALFSVGNTKIPLIGKSPCNPHLLAFDYAASESDTEVSCGNHVMELFASGKIHIRETTL